MKYALISVTQKTRAGFDEDTPLGATLKRYAPLLRDYVVTDIVTDNQEGLSVCYNRALQRARQAGCGRAMLLHDDVQLDDGLVFDKLDQAFQQFDIVGAAGARSLSVNTRKIAWWEAPPAHKAGWVTHPMYDRRDAGYYLEYYGPAPMPCVVLDGLFMAMNLERVRACPFDEQFTFDFYDLDCTLSHHLEGLTVGVWPLALTHLSRGQGHTSDRFREAQERFRRKYKGIYRPVNITKKWWMVQQWAGRRAPNPPGEFSAGQRPEEVRS